MKVILTKAELLSIISKHLRVKVTDFDIVHVGAKIVAVLQKAIGAFDYRGGGKISAIKALRVASCEFNANKDAMGLADSKWAVENWEQFAAFVKDNGRLPEPGIGWEGSLR
jgi:hypothetical protein